VQPMHYKDREIVTEKKMNSLAVREQKRHTEDTLGHPKHCDVNSKETQQLQKGFMLSLILVASRPIAHNKIHDWMLNTTRPHGTKKSTDPFQLRKIICLVELGSNQRNGINFTSLKGLPRSKNINHQTTFCSALLRCRDVK
jgi:hypothetical protein